MKKQYDSSWDLIESEDGNLPDGKDAFDGIYAKWVKRAWLPWLKSQLSFPFEVERKEDNDDAYFTDVEEIEPFRLGHKMKVTGIELEDDHYGLIVTVQEGRNTGHVPLCDLEVTSRENENFWPVREYVVWFANQ